MLVRSFGPTRLASCGSVRAFDLATPTPVLVCYCVKSFKISIASGISEAIRQLKSSVSPNCPENKSAFNGPSVKKA